MTNVDLLRAIIADKQQTAAALSIADDLVRVDLSLADARSLLAELESQAARIAKLEAVAEAAQKLIEWEGDFSADNFSFSEYWMHCSDIKAALAALNS